MKGIIIAAGPSTRLRPLTEDNPKSMVIQIKGKPLLQHTIENLQNSGCKDISIIRGFKSNKINFDGVSYFENNDFWDNNILHSLLHARAKIEEAIASNEDIIVSYSDIWYSSSVLDSLSSAKEHISAVVDVDWQDYYEGRSDHPIDEAENVIMDENKKIVKIGKHIFTEQTPKDKQGEFIGLWKFTPQGASTFLKHIDRLNQELSKTDPFQNAKEWQKAYITDIFQELTDQGEEVYCTVIHKNWKEFDTVQDFERFEAEQ